MTNLDDLISSSASVPGVTPDVLGKGRAELAEAIAAGESRESAAYEKARSRWAGPGGLRGKTIIGGVAGVAAAAAAAALIVLPSSGTHTLPSSGAHPAGKALAAPPIPATLTAVSYSVAPLTAPLTSATVFAQAAKGAQAAGYSPEGNPQLLKGWPNARFWYTVEEYTNSLCPGQATVGETWIGKAGNGAIRDSTAGSVPAADRGISQCKDSGPSAEAYGPTPGPFLGGQLYSWAQFAALPTSPAALWPILQADSKVGVASQKGIPEEDWLYDTIILTLESDPVAPAMRMALLADAEKIPGVIPVGTYTDSEGRTGVALRVTWNEGPGGTDTTVVDTSNGQILAELQTEPGQQGCTTTKPKGGGTEISCIVSNSGTVFLSAAAVNSAPPEASLPPAVVHVHKGAPPK